MFSYSTRNQTKTAGETQAPALPRSPPFPSRWLAPPSIPDRHPPVLAHSDSVTGYPASPAGALYGKSAGQRDTAGARKPSRITGSDRQLGSWCYLDASTSPLKSREAGAWGILGIILCPDSLPYSLLG